MSVEILELRNEYQKLKKKSLSKQGIETDPEKHKSETKKLEDLRHQIKTKEQELVTVRINQSNN